MNMNDFFYPVAEDCQCWNCKTKLPAGTKAHHQYDNNFLCDDCMRECIAHNDYIESVSQDYPAI